MTYEITKLDPRTREIILHPNTGPFEALAHINPEMAVVAYAHKSGLINEKNMPLLANFRYLQSKEKMALVNSMTDQYLADKRAQTDMYRVDGAVTITKEVQRGLTIRNETSETEATKRALIQAEAMEKAKRMDYEVSVRAINANLEERKYLSDNQLIAVREEAEARKNELIAVNQIRADAERGISRDRLEERVRIATMEFNEKMALAQTYRDVKRDEAIVETTKSWLEYQTKIMTEMVIYHGKIGLAKERTNQEKERTAQKSLDVGMHIADRAMQTGQEEVDLSINLDGRRIDITYKAPKGKK